MPILNRWWHLTHVFFLGIQRTKDLVIDVDKYDGFKNLIEKVKTDTDTKSGHRPNGVE